MTENLLNSDYNIQSIFVCAGAEFVDSFSDDQRAFFVFNEETTDPVKV